jgi:hypothetical protein
MDGIAACPPATATAHATNLSRLPVGRLPVRPSANPVRVRCPPPYGKISAESSVAADLPFCTVYSTCAINVRWRKTWRIGAPPPEMIDNRKGPLHAMIPMGNHSARLRSDLGAFLLTMVAIAVCGVGFRLKHVGFLPALAEASIGLYVIRFSRLAYRDPVETIEAWQHFYSSETRVSLVAKISARDRRLRALRRFVADNYLHPCVNLRISRAPGFSMASDSWVCDSGSAAYSA